MNEGLNAGGWTVMILSLSGVLALVTFCFYRVFRTPSTQEHMHSPLDIDTHDKDT